MCMLNQRVFKQPFTIKVNQSPSNKKWAIKTKIYANKKNYIKINKNVTTLLDIKSQSK